jgi:acyl carrier protein
MRNDIYDTYFQELTQVIINIIPSLSEYEFKLDSDLEELGASSLDRSEIIHEFLYKLNLEIPMISFSNKMQLQQILSIVIERG